MTDREAVLKAVQMISELQVYFAEAKAKLNTIIPVSGLDTLYNKFRGTELGDTLKPLNQADVLLGEIAPYITLYTAGAIDETEVIKRFKKRSKTALNNVTVEGYISLADVYLKAYSSPLNSLDEIMDILSAKYINPEIVPC